MIDLAQGVLTTKAVLLDHHDVLCWVERNLLTPDHHGVHGLILMLFLKLGLVFLKLVFEVDILKEFVLFFGWPRLSPRNCRACKQPFAFRLIRRTLRGSEGPHPILYLPFDDGRDDCCSLCILKWPKLKLCGSCRGIDLCFPEVLLSIVDLQFFWLPMQRLVIQQVTQGLSDGRFSI